MKRILLTTAQLRVIEDLVIKYGQIVTTKQILELLQFQTQESKYRFISQLAKSGWLVRIKQGLYQIVEMSSLGMLTISPYAVAHLILEESYVSFYAALQYHSLFDQGLRTCSSVSLKQRRTVQSDNTIYTFLKTTERHFYGFETFVYDGQSVAIATAEKAIIDLLHFDRNAITVDIVLEILRDNHQLVDLVRLQEYALLSSVAAQRSLGFLLDRLGFDSHTLLSESRNNTSVSRLTPECTVYDTVWRIYYDSHFTNQLIPYDFANGAVSPTASSHQSTTSTVSS